MEADEQVQTRADTAAVIALALDSSQAGAGERRQSRVRAEREDVAAAEVYGIDTVPMKRVDASLRARRRPRLRVRDAGTDQGGSRERGGPEERRRADQMGVRSRSFHRRSV